MKVVQTLKNWMLPIAMTTGVLLHQYLYHLSFLMPWLIFTMLLFTFGRIAPRDVQFNRLHVYLILIQLLFSVALYIPLSFLDPVVAEGVFICILAPTATAAAVITGLLGGSVGFLTTNMLLSNLAVSVAAPLLFSFIGINRELPLTESMWNIAKEVFPLLILPLGIAWMMRWVSPKSIRVFERLNKVPLYLWALSLTIVTGRTVHYFFIRETDSTGEEWWLAGLTMIVCFGQFFGGRSLGKMFAEPISAGQSLMQKNTVLALWLSQIYLSPVAAVGPAAYILWQNIVNSYQLWKKGHKK